MSVIDKCAFEILSIEAATAAVKEMGGELVQQSTYKWHNPSPKPCDYVIKVPGSAWEIGLVKKGKSYQMECDVWGSEGGKLSKFIGGLANPTLFKRAYTKHLYAIEGKRKGYLVSHKTVGNKIVITLTKP